jgi:hypothetical protein
MRRPSPHIKAAGCLKVLVLTKQLAVARLAKGLQLGRERYIGYREEGGKMELSYKSVENPKIAMANPNQHYESKPFVKTIDAAGPKYEAEAIAVTRCVEFGIPFDQCR